MESRGKFTAEKLLPGPTLPPSFDVHSPIAMKIHIHLTQIPANQILGNQHVLGGFAAAAAVRAPRGHQNPSLGAQEWHHCSLSTQENER